MLVNDLGGDEDGGGADGAPALEVVNEIRNAAGEAEATIGSVADRNAAGPIVEQAVRDFGGLDGVVNNAGALRDAIFHKMAHVNWHTAISGAPELPRARPVAGRLLL